MTDLTSTWLRWWTLSHSKQACQRRAQKEQENKKWTRKSLWTTFFLKYLYTLIPDGRWNKLPDKEIFLSWKKGSSQEVIFSEIIRGAMLFTFRSESFLALIEYVPFGDLLGYLRKSRGLNDTYFKDPDFKSQTNLTSQQLMKFAWKIADGMSYLSSKSVSCNNLFLMTLKIVKNYFFPCLSMSNNYGSERWSKRIKAVIGISSC